MPRSRAVAPRALPIAGVDGRLPVGHEHGQPVTLGLELVPGLFADRLERLEHDPRPTAIADLGPPEARDEAVDRERRQDVTRRDDDLPPMLGRKDPRAVLIGEQGLVPHRQESGRRRLVRVGEGGLGQVEEVPSVLVREAPDVRDPREAAPQARDAQS